MSKFTAPRAITWWISLIIGVIGVIAHLTSLGVLTTYSFWIVVVGFALLLLGTLLKGL